MSHILITGASSYGRTEVIRETIVPAYKNTHDIVRVPTGSTATGLRKTARQVNPDRPTLVIIDEVRRSSIIEATELLLNNADSSKVLVVAVAETGTVRTHPGKVHNLHLGAEHFVVLDAAAQAAA